LGVIPEVSYFCNMHSSSRVDISRSVARGMKAVGSWNLHYMVIITVYLNLIAISGHFPDAISIPESV